MHVTAYLHDDNAPDHYFAVAPTQRPGPEMQMSKIHRLALIPFLLLGAACAASTPVPPYDAAPTQALSPQDAFWANLQALCPSAAEGRLLSAPIGDTQIDPDARLVVHFWECGDDELRFPLHVDENRSRTWVLIRHEDRLELRHDHRNEDGTEEENTWYGDFTLDEGTATSQEFISERNGMRFGWRIVIEPGATFRYGTIRNGEWRHHLAFDISSPVPAPPMHWGYEKRPSQRQ